MKVKYLRFSYGYLVATFYVTAALAFAVFLIVDYLLPGLNR